MPGGECIVVRRIVSLFPQAVDLPREFELRAESPQFWKLVSRDAKFAMVATGFGVGSAGFL
jgi:hypothetical protein